MKDRDEKNLTELENEIESVRNAKGNVGKLMEMISRMFRVPLPSEVKGEVNQDEHRRATQQIQRAADLERKAQDLGVAIDLFLNEGDRKERERQDE